MGSKPLQVLLVEDSEDDAELVLLALRRGGYEPFWERVQTAKDLGDALSRKSWEVIISDFSMPSFSAPQAFALVKERGIDVPFIIVSGTVGEDVAVEAMKSGVNDYLIKGALARLVPAVEREIRDAAVRNERKKADERLALLDQMLRQSQKMEAIGRLASGIAHDFNNLLAVIVSYTDMLIRDGILPQPRGEDLQEIHTAAMRAAELTRQLLAFSRRQVLEPRILDLNEVITSLDRMLRRVIGSDVSLTTIPSSDLGRIKADYGSVEQVIVNLAVNARDAMPGGGRLIIETANVDLDETYAAEHFGLTAGPHVMVAVTDTGTGIPRDVQPRIFEPFFTTKETGKGTGLGLSTVLGIVQQSGGSIFVYSEPGKGTTFKLYFPRTDEAATQVRTSAPPENLVGTETVLVVEDDSSVRRAVARVLQNYDYRVIHADTPNKALELCGSSEGVDVLITDVVMPEMSGRELAERAIALRPELRVLYVSGYTDNTILDRGALAPGIHFLQKPFTPEALGRKVREVIEEPS
jgi:two-component system, cell cycle sensor histidine kinase and response regulator CckA